MVATKTEPGSAARLAALVRRAAGARHATREQLRAAYPRVGEFAAVKRRYDPQLRFRNALWDTYLA